VGKRMTCFILSSAPIEDYSGIRLPERTKDDLVIAADAGFRHAGPLGLTVDILIGDFDSLPGDAVKICQGLEIIRLPREKDITDTWAALDKGLERGFKDFFIVGALGGKRIDHTVGNICLLAYLNEKQARGVLADSHNTVLLLGEGSHTLEYIPGRNLSLIPFDGDAIVSLKGFLYPLENALLKSSRPMGISNRFLSKTADITVKKGKLLAFFSKD